MEIKHTENACIFTPLTPKLDSYSTERLFSEINSTRKISAIDLTFVQECTIDFLSTLVEYAKIEKLSIFNIPAEIFVLFNVMNIDKSVHLYVNKEDFEQNSRQLVNRKLAVV